MRIKEQGTHLTLNEHDDDDDDEETSSDSLKGKGHLVDQGVDGR